MGSEWHKQITGGGLQLRDGWRMDASGVKNNMNPAPSKGPLLIIQAVRHFSMGWVIARFNIIVVLALFGCCLFCALLHINFNMAAT